MDRSEMFETMVESVGVGVGVYGEDGRYVYVNEAYADLLGTDREVLVGIPVWTVIPEFDGNRFEDYWDSFEDGETRTAETVHEYGDTRVPVSAVTTRRQIAGAPYHFGTIQDISELKERERELRRKNERLEAFTAVVSHDLRNPLSVAKGHLEVLQDDVDRDEIDLIESSLDRMAILLDDLLRLAREGHSVDDAEPVSLAGVAAAARETVRTDGATVTVEDDLRFMADESRLQQLLENLLRNAVEHGSTSPAPGEQDAVEHGSTSPDSQARQDAVEHGSTSSRTGSDDAVEHASEDGAPTIRVGALPDEPGFFVEDDGPGIPADEREAVFSPTQSEGNRGVGLGLAIVDEIVEAHGWSIRVTEGRDGGARFEVTGVEPA